MSRQEAICVVAPPEPLQVLRWERCCSPRLFLTLVLRDIGRSNRQRRELEAANRRANDLLLAREKMMLAITHDFKAPLGSILGYADRADSPHCR